MSAYPERLTEVWRTSDGKLHASKEEAHKHEVFIRTLKAVRKATSAARHHEFGERVRTDDPTYIEALAAFMAQDFVLKDAAT